MFKTIFKILLLLVVTGYLAFALTMSGHPQEEAECKGLDIVVNDENSDGLVNENDIRELLIANKQFPEGRALKDIDLACLESILVASPYIDEALCYQTAEGRLSMQVTPRIPIIHVLNNDGEDFYIDNHGSIIPRGRHTMNLLVMTGNVPKSTAGKLYTPMGLTLTADEFWNKQIQEIHVTDEGEIQLTPLVGQHIIIIGDTSHLSDKLQRMKAFYKEGLNKTGWNMYKTINLTYDNQVICTK